MRKPEYDGIEKHQAAMAALGRRVTGQEAPAPRMQRVWDYIQQSLGLVAVESTQVTENPFIEDDEMQSPIELFGEDQVADVIDLDSWREQSTNARREQQS